MLKAHTAWSRAAELYDTTIGGGRAGGIQDAFRAWTASYLLTYCHLVRGSPDYGLARPDAAGD